MPNGFTSKIYDGEPQSLRDYLMGVGRGFGFAIMQRDDPWDAPVRHVKPSNYHVEKIAEATEKLRELETMTTAEAHAAAREDYDAALVKWQDRNETNRLMGVRYDQMIDQVEAWDPGDARFDDLKEQALKYLRESRDFDVSNEEQQRRYNPYPTMLSGDGWLHREKKAQRDLIDYHTEQNRQEIKRADERNEWIDAFLKSLPPEA
jgi:hypothetical protein